MARLDRPSTGSRRFLRVPLRLVLVVPFVLQIFGAVGLTGYLSLRNGQKAVNEVTSQLRNEVTARVQQHLDRYLTTAEMVNQAALDVIQLELVDLQDFSAVQRLFWQQVQSFDSANTIQFGSQQGEYIGAGRLQDGTLTLKVADRATDNAFHTYVANPQGQRTTLLTAKPDYDPRVRPWYQVAAETGKTAWSPTYLMFSHRQLGLTLSDPVYDRTGQFLGVLGTDILLSEVSQFLQALKIGQSGQVFIFERSGEMVASSRTLEPFLMNPTTQDLERIHVTNDPEEAVRLGTQTLLAEFGDFHQISKPAQLDFKLAGERQFLQVTPFQDGRGIDWLIVVLVPEADFMAQIEASTRTTIQLCILALLLASTLGLFTARWITQPILRLCDASSDIASGDFRQVKIEREDELGTLARTFNQMSEQLKASHAQLANYSRSLEQKVDERTQALQQEVAERTAAEMALRFSQEKFYKAFRSSPDLITISTLEDGQYIEVNDSFLRISGYSPAEAIGQTSLELKVWANAEDRDRVVKTLRDRAILHNYEYEFCTKQGDVRTMLLSAEIIELADCPCLLAVHHDITERKQASLALQAEREKSERLLLNILPQPIVKRLKQGQALIADQFAEVTILFADIVDFTPLANDIPPTELVDLLNQIFSTFDRLAEQHQVEKVKTVGDAYMAVAGVPLPESGAEAIADIALEMQAAIAQFNRPNGLPFQLRIGINTGPVVAGVIGIRKFAYDLWGDTVNVASRMESQGQPGRIQVTASTYERLRHRYTLQKRGDLDVKGRGQMTTYWLLGRHPN